MEFSFDRSNEANLQNITQSNNGPNPNLPQEASGPAEKVNSNNGEASTITNERLRKAIEKNRARQAERARVIPDPVQAPVNKQSSLFDTKQSRPPEAPLKAHAEERVHDNPKASTVVTRRNTARANEAEFTPVKRTSRKVGAQISYTTSGRKKLKPIDPTIVAYLVKGCWIFCSIIVLRLLFSHGGVSDFYSQRTIYNNRLEELDRIKKENMSLVHEIERMQTDASFQKKLVRDNLGFIASDEYLILFPKEK